MIQRFLRAFFGIVILGSFVVALWSQAMNTDVGIQAIATDNFTAGAVTATTGLQTAWPLMLLALGLGLGFAAVVWALKQFKLI